MIGRFFFIQSFYLYLVRSLKTHFTAPNLNFRVSELSIKVTCVFHNSGGHVKCTLRGDTQTLVRRPGSDAENQPENNRGCVDTEAANAAWDKIKEHRGRSWDEVEWKLKSSERSNGLKDKIERRMKSRGRCGAIMIGQTTDEIDGDQSV
jgi:hypothetical protein